MPRIQSFCKANIINIGYFDGVSVFPRLVTARNKALYLYNNPSCLIWKSQCVSFNQAIQKLKKNKKVDNYISEENANAHFKYEFIQKK